MERMTYNEWCNIQELRYDFMPPWYWNEAERRRRYLSAYPNQDDGQVGGRGQRDTGQRDGEREDDSSRVHGEHGSAD